MTPADLILYSLEDLTSDDFKKLKNKLSDLDHRDKRPIPRGRLEKADCITTKDLLIGTYGDEGALDVMTEVFTHIGYLGLAEKLQKRRSQSANLTHLTLDNRIKDWKKEYMDSMKEDFQRVKEHNSCRGEAVNLQRRYTNLLLVKGLRNRKEKSEEITSSGRGHLQIMEKRSSDKHFSTTIPALFDSDEDGFTPKTVVLQGPAGIGKTMTSKKIMLDWASANLYQDKFDVVFYLSCRELNTIDENLNFIGLLSRACQQLCTNDLASILKEPRNQRKLLFIVDGFDEFRWTLKEKSKVCVDMFKETHKEILIQSLLRRQILKPSSLVITTRSMALEKLNTFIDDYHYVEVLGFTGADREEYFHNFFPNKEDADKALSVIKNNKVLCTLCAVPIVCWIVCTVLKPQINQDLRQYKTPTSIYLLYLKGLIKYHGRDRPAHDCLKKLCALANEGVIKRQILFKKEDLERHGLSLSDIESVFLNENIFHLDIDNKAFYSFIHLSVQEFFAALYYALDDGSENRDPSLPEICTGNSLLDFSNLFLTVRFLFGLLNEEITEAFSESTGIRISLQAKSGEMAKWLSTVRSSHYPHEVFICLYETQNVDFIRRFMNQSTCLTIDFLEISGTDEEDYVTQLCYCLNISHTFQDLTFSMLILDGKRLEMLSPFLHKCQRLRFTKCRFHQRSQHGRHLMELSESEGQSSQSDDGEDKGLSWLVNPQSEIQELDLEDCGLTPECCDHLRSVLITNRSLTKLGLYWNHLESSGVKILCDGLRDPGCTLQELRIEDCDLTPECCDDLRSVLITNRSLTKLGLYQNRFGNSGVKILCDGLRDPGCTLQTFIFNGCGLSLSCCDDLCSVISTNQTLTKLEADLYTDSTDPEVDRVCDVLGQLGCSVEKYRINQTIIIEIEYNRETSQI